MEKWRYNSIHSEPQHWIGYVTSFKARIALPREKILRYPLYRRVVLVPRAGLDILRKREIYCLRRESSHDYSVLHLKWGRAIGQLAVIVRGNSDDLSRNRVMPAVCYIKPCEAHL